MSTRTSSPASPTTSPRGRTATARRSSSAVGRGSSCRPAATSLRWSTRRATRRRRTTSTRTSRPTPTNGCAPPRPNRAPGGATSPSGSTSAPARSSRRPPSWAGPACRRSRMRRAPTSTTSESGESIMFEQDYSGIGRSRGTDFFGIADQLTQEELDYWNRTRHFVDDEVLPVINDYWERAEFPRPLIEKLGALGIVGDGIEGYGCPPMSPIANGLIHLELNRGDGSLGTFVGVQAGLDMQSIAMLGSEEQKERWLPPMAQLTTIGAFALTEPAHGSDSVGLETSARCDGDTWVIDGEKKWIGNGTSADVVVVWARDVADGQVKGFLVEKGTPGYDAQRIDGKGSLRAVWQAEIQLTDVRVPEGNRLPLAHSFKDAGAVLAGTRNTVAWSALGHATAAFDAAMSYCRQRVQFGKPLVSFQIVQERLVKMLAELCGMQLYCLRLGRLIEEGRLSDTIAALAKMNNTSKARQLILDARDLLGGNGILLDFHVMRHLADMEAIHTYEGTETIQTLIIGRDITGVGAFA